MDVVHGCTVDGLCEFSSFCPLLRSGFRVCQAAPIRGLFPHPQMVGLYCSFGRLDIQRIKYKLLVARFLNPRDLSRNPNQESLKL